MRRHWRKLLLMIVAYSVALAMTVPASLALQWAAPFLDRLPQRPALHGVEGTIWKGHAAQLVYRGVAIGSVDWDISLSYLLLGSLTGAVAVTPENGHVTGSVSRSLFSDKWRLERFEGQLPAQIANQLMPSLPLKPQGTLVLNLTKIMVTDNQLHEVDGRVVWNRAAISSPTPLELGDLVTQWHSEEETVIGQVQDAGGPLQLQAELILKQGRKYALSGSAMARNGAESALSTSLSLIGQADAQGVVRFQQQGMF